MNKTIIAIVIVAVVLVGGYFFFRGSRLSPENTSTAPINGETSTPPVSAPSSNAVTPQSPVGQAPIVEERIITYTDSGYSPATLRIKKGETATFKNQSSQSMWTASAVHPTHLAYPTIGGCIGGTFDACKGVQSGDSWSFKFDIAGTWKYHNHLSPSDTGTIIVQ